MRGREGVLCCGLQGLICRLNVNTIKKSHRIVGRKECLQGEPDALAPRTTTLTPGIPCSCCLQKALSSVATIHPALGAALGLSATWCPLKYKLQGTVTCAPRPGLSLQEVGDLGSGIWPWPPRLSTACFFLSNGHSTP